MPLTQEEILQINDLLKQTGATGLRKIQLKAEIKRLNDELTIVHDELHKLQYGSNPARDRIEEILQAAQSRVEEVVAKEPEQPSEDGRPFNKYVIDYKFGVANFFTRETDEPQALREFDHCANECFGIRKAIGDVAVKSAQMDVAPLVSAKLGYFTHFLSHHGEEIVFDRRYTTDSGEGWKLMNESGDWCSCAQRGQAELSCEVHHFWVPDHNTVCPCMEKKAVTK